MNNRDPWRRRPIINYDADDRLGMLFSQWLKKTAADGQVLEFLSEPLYDTVWIESGITSRIDFFIDVNKHPSLTNMYLPRVLPEPQSFMITGIRLFGITSALQFGSFRLHIGNRHYGTWPTWALSVREKRFEYRPIFIPSSLMFRAEITWEAPPILGAGVNGRPKEWEPVQCFLRGIKGRPIC